MKFRSLMTAICVLATANIVSAAPFAYVANSGTNKLSVIDTAITPTGDGSNTITATVTLPTGTSPYPYGVAVSPSGQYVYVGIQGTKQIAVIDTVTNTLLTAFTINLTPDSPGGLAINAAETRLYVASNLSNTLNVFDISNIKTGSGAIPEVGRVTVADDSISNPEGVVLSPNGLKAYVANSTKGSIAEISLDEINDIYTRTNLISLGNNAQPMGLTISSDGTKLYAAGFNGHASVVDTATRAVTDLPLSGGVPLVVRGTGNLSVAITPDNGKIYAPSAGYNNMYSIIGTSVAELGGQNTLSNSPWGSSIVPVTPTTNPTKLYVTMNLSDNVKVFNTADNSLLATIDLTATAGAGAKPTSMGNFIGPELPYVIAASAGTNCTISPAGSIAVNNKGRVFNISASSGQCEVFIGSSNCDTTGGTSQGVPASFAYANVSANGCIYAKPISGVSYILSGGWIPSVSSGVPYLVSTPSGIDATHTSAQFKETTVVTLSVGDAVNHQVQSGSWTGDCAYANTPFSPTCTLTMSANKTFGATIIDKIAAPPTGPVYNVTKSSYHQTCAEATTAATTNDEIKVSTDISTCTTTGTAGVTVKMSSQWVQPAYTATGYSALALTITDVAVVADGLIL